MERIYTRRIYAEKLADEILRSFAVSSSLPSVDPLDDENSEINKIGREIAEMSDEEFEANCKPIEKLLKGSKLTFRRLA